MKQIFIGLYVSRFCRASALFVMCAMLSSCSSPTYQQRQENLSMWEAAGKPPMLDCEYSFNHPFGIKTKAPSRNLEPQAYTSMRDFSQAATAAQAPIWECAVLGGSDTAPNATPDAAQIAKMDWGSFGYSLLHTRHPGIGVAYYYLGGGGYYVEDPQIGPMFLGDDFKTYTYHYDEPTRYSDRISAAYDARYLAYEQIPQDNAQATLLETGLYAMQGFRCAIRMRDFDAARRYWALAISTNPKFTYTYAQVGLLVIFQVFYKSQRWNDPRLDEKTDSGAAYLSIPQDIRSAVWNAAGQYYSPSLLPDNKLFSMKQAEDAAQAETLNKIFSRKNVPLTFLSSLYCPVFYPDFDPIAAPEYSIPSRFSGPSYPLSSLRSAAGRVSKETEKANKD